MATIKETLKEKIVTLIIPAVIALLTIFSDKIVEQVKLSVNRANLRTSHYERLSSEISFFAFASENVTEYYENGWTTKSSLEAIVPDYNNAITSLRKNEYVTFGLLHRFWEKGDVERFQRIMETVKKIDVQIHSMNAEAEAVVTGKKERADLNTTKPVTDRLKVLNKELDEGD